MHEHSCLLLYSFTACIIESPPLWTRHNCNLGLTMQVHIDKGVIKAEDLTAMIEELESYGSRGLGARIIAK